MHQLLVSWHIVELAFALLKYFFGFLSFCLRKERVSVCLVVVGGILPDDVGLGGALVLSQLLFEVETFESTD